MFKQNKSRVSDIFQMNLSLHLQPVQSKTCYQYTLPAACLFLFPLENNVACQLISPVALVVFGKAAVRESPGVLLTSSSNLSTYLLEGKQASPPRPVLLKYETWAGRSLCCEGRQEGVPGGKVITGEEQLHHSAAGAEFSHVKTAMMKQFLL